MEVRKLSFGAGPALWPDEVLAEAAEALRLDGSSGLSVLEHFHRESRYQEIHDAALARLARLLGDPAEHEILLMTGGATLQFALVPQNLRPAGASADYLVSGHWARRAADYARQGGTVRVVASGEASGFASVPDPESWDCDPSAAYLHLTSGNTVAGTALSTFPPASAVPLVVDATADVLTRRFPLESVGVLYAAAQKNLGPAGLTLVVIRRDLLERAPETLAPVLRYRDIAASGSHLNTPPTALVFLLERFLAWIEREGGAAEMERRTAERARIVYSALDAAPERFAVHAAEGHRSPTNVVFRLRREEEQPAFLAAAEKAGLVGLAGHRSVGGLRASLYAAMPVEGARRLAEFLTSWAASS